MGKKIPLWQVIIVFIVLLIILYWGIMVDTESMGAALMGVGIALGFSPAMTAGAVVSGSYFGDKMSPLSDTTNLAPAVAGTTLFVHIGHMIYTVTPSLIIAQNEQIWGKLGSLLSASGMQGMMWTISLILCAMCFGGIVDCSGMMGQLADLILKLARGTRGGLVTCTSSSEEPFQMLRRLRYSYIQFLSLEHLRRNYEKLPSGRLQLHSFCDP